NHRIQVFDLDLNFVRSIGSRGKGRGEFDAPYDVKFDTAGNMYVAEFGNERVQVMDTSGHFIRVFFQKGEGKLRWPSGLHVADKYVYVSDLSGNCIVVYETSGQSGQKEGEFRGPRCITSCVDGFIHVCDYRNNRVQIF
ncbi:RING finger protein nhl-1, partial [Geodia barretti]